MITDELREWIRARGMMAKETFDQLTAIADRIDAAHERTFRNLTDALHKQEDATRDLDEKSVLLPVDANGEYIHIGDVMVMASHPFGCEDKPLVVDRMELSRDRHGEVWCLALDTDRSCWTQAAVLRHYHAPTVEDVLREFTDEVKRCCDTQDTIAEYAAKLRLAEEDK